MHQYAGFIQQMQSWIEGGSAALAQGLAVSEWQQMDFSENTVDLESDVMKMMVVLEAIFEHTRKKLASHLPSRLDCVFVWPTWEAAKRFRQEYIPEGVIHRCLLQGEAVELDGGLVPPGINLSDLSHEAFASEFRATQLRAQKYWLAQESPELPELLVAGNVEVARIETER